MTIPTDRLLDLTNRRLRTGEVAQRAGVNVQALGYYERRGLIAAPARSPGGHRTYPSDTVTVIKAAQRLGFTLDDPLPFADLADLADLAEGDLA